MKRRRWTIPLICGAVAACSPQIHQATAELGVGGIAKVMGRITSSAGQPLDSVAVRIYLEAPGAFYSSPQAFTDRNGEYSVEVERLGAGFTGDSLILGAVAIVRIARLDTPNALGPIYRDSVALTFFQPTATATVTRFDYQVSKP